LQKFVGEFGAEIVERFLQELLEFLQELLRGFFIEIIGSFKRVVEGFFAEIRGFCLQRLGFLENCYKTC
jgi:hypothetical protein